MARKKTANASTARATVKAPTRGAAPSRKAAEAAAAPAPVEAVAAPPARSVAAAKPAANSKPTPAAAPAAKPAIAADQGLEVLATLGQDNLDACVTCGTIVFKGLEILGNEVITVTRANIAANIAATESLMAAKTLDEVIDLQAGFARDRLEGMANESAKIGALTMDVANQALEPLRSRFDATTRTVLRPFGL